MDAEQRTQIAVGAHGAAFDPAGAGPTALDFVWGRDRTSAPAPGHTGDVLQIDEDLFSKTFRARRADGSSVAVELRRDEVEPARFPACWNGVDNRVLAAIWRRRTIASVADDAPSGEAPLSLGYEPFDPLLVCREKGIMFHVPSPVSGRVGALVDCEDEAVLQLAGLPSYARTTARFLMDEGGLRTSALPRFWTAMRDIPRDARVKVGSWETFASDLGGLVERAATGDRSITSLGRGFPCAGCDQISKCYPRPVRGAGAAPQAPLAAKRLAPVALHPFRALALREEVVDFDEHCDVLGGATWPAFRARHLQRWVHPGRRLAREKLESLAFERAEAVDGPTALRAKLGLFESVVAAVARFHRTHGTPHLLLSPRTVVSNQLFEAMPHVALRASLQAAMLEDLFEAPPGAPIWLPPPGAEAPYAHGDVIRASSPATPTSGKGQPPAGAQDLRFGVAVPVRITVGRIWEDAATGQTEAELNLAGVPRATEGIEPTDRFRILVTSRGWESTALWARPDFERREQGCVTLRTFPAALDSAQLLDLRGASSGRALFANAAAYRTYGAWYDLHALGVMLLRAVLENARQPMAKLSADVFPALVPMARVARGGRGRSHWDDLVEKIAELVRTPPIDRALAPDNVCWLPEEVGAKDAIPPRLWAEVLATGVACVAEGGAASFCSTTRLEPDRDRFCAPVEALLARVRAVRAALADAAPAKSRRRSRGSTRTVAAAPTAAIDTLQPVVTEAIAPAPGAARIRELEKELTSLSARIERLEAENATLREAAARAGKKPAAGAAANESGLWREIEAAVTGASPRTGPAPGPGDLRVQLTVRLLSEGLGALSTALTAIAELGGQEFATEQRNLQRLIRQAMTAVATESPDAEQRAREALATLETVRTTIGAAVGALVEAYGSAAYDGSRRLLATVELGLRNELRMEEDQTRRFESLMSRIREGLADLIARLYDPVFQEHVRRHVAGGAAARRKEGT